MCSLRIRGSFVNRKRKHLPCQPVIASQGKCFLFFAFCKRYSFLLYIYSSSFFLYLRYKLTPIAVPAAAMIVTTYTVGR